MDGPHKQEFHVRNLPTRSVTLFPSRAQIVRDIKDVTLKVCCFTAPYPLRSSFPLTVPSSPEPMRLPSSA
jgi:hypothetical protein